MRGIHRRTRILANAATCQVKIDGVLGLPTLADVLAALDGSLSLPGAVPVSMFAKSAHNTRAGRRVNINTILTPTERGCSPSRASWTAAHRCGTMGLSRTDSRRCTADDDKPRVRRVPCPPLPNRCSAPRPCGRSCSPSPCLRPPPRPGSSSAHWVEVARLEEGGGDEGNGVAAATSSRDVFGQVLGYTGPAAGRRRYTLKREATVQVDGKFADAALGRFSTADDGAEYIAAVEGKGPRDPLDRPFAGRKLSAVDQALRYAVNLRMRLVSRHQPARNPASTTRGTTSSPSSASRRLPWPATTRPSAGSSSCWARSEWSAAAGGCHLDNLLAESRRIGLELTRDYYREYADLRREDVLPPAPVQLRRAAGPRAGRHANDSRPRAVHRLLRGPRPVAAGVHRQGLPPRRSLQPPADLGQLPRTVPMGERREPATGDRPLQRRPVRPGRTARPADRAG